VRVLLDECLPRRLRRELPGHEVLTVAEAGWAGFSNGELLRRAAQTFDVFVTVDRNLAFQQNLPTLPIAVVVLTAVSNEFEQLQPLMPEVLALLPGLAAGQLIRVGG
jgi:predicted nuclease of predicted toxin-antitoxin system